MGGPILRGDGHQHGHLMTSRTEPGQSRQCGLGWAWLQAPTLTTETSHSSICLHPIAKCVPAHNYISPALLFGSWLPHCEKSRQLGHVSKLLAAEKNVLWRKQGRNLCCYLLNELHHQGTLGDTLMGYFLHAVGGFLLKHPATLCGCAKAITTRGGLGLKFQPGNSSRVQGCQSAMTIFL